jgi:hypothetical protein
LVGSSARAIVTVERTIKTPGRHLRRAADLLEAVPMMDAWMMIPGDGNYPTLASPE